MPLEEILAFEIESANLRVLQVHGQKSQQGDLDRYSLYKVEAVKLSCCGFSAKIFTHR